ncbi:MAG: hypothetical protein RL641_161 [Candidatus Parcubacteria bacterium]
MNYHLKNVLLAFAAAITDWLLWKNFAHSRLTFVGFLVSAIIAAYIIRKVTTNSIADFILRFFIISALSFIFINIPAFLFYLFVVVLF